VSHHAPRPSRGAVDEVRAYATSAVAAHSLRRVAQQVGMSAGGLQKFLDGAMPTPPVYRKLRVWYDRRANLEPAEASTAGTRSPAPTGPREDDGEGDLGEVPIIVRTFTRPEPD
jgi:hypothetical protein